MDVYKLDQSIGSNIGNAPPPEKIQPQVTFDAGAEFNLSFFDNHDDHESTQGFSDPGSVGSAPEPSPPPPPAQQGGAASSSGLVQLQPPSSSSNSKQGRKQGSERNENGSRTCTRNLYFHCSSATEFSFSPSSLFQRIIYFIFIFHFCLFLRVSKAGSF